VDWGPKSTSSASELSIIQFKAKSLFSKLKEEIGEESHNIEFNASRGWFERFKNRLIFII